MRKKFSCVLFNIFKKRKWKLWKKKKEQYKPLRLQVNFQNHDWMQALDFPIYHTVNLKQYLAKQLFFLSIALWYDGLLSFNYCNQLVLCAVELWFKDEGKNKQTLTCTANYIYKKCLAGLAQVLHLGLSLWEKKKKRLEGEILKADKKLRKCTSSHIFGCTAKALYVNKSKRIK